MAIRFPAEWEAQDGVLLAWPHEKSDWAPCLQDAQRVFVSIILAISRFEKVLLVVPPGQKSPVLDILSAAGADIHRLTLFEITTNDTWARDFGPLCVSENGAPRLLDFGFNGWGLKFPADLDNLINRKLHDLGAFGATPMDRPEIILEGGSIESDGNGTLLTTARCLQSPNRNPHLDQRGIEAALGQRLGCHRFLWLENGHLAGDDTDSHIDTLARLCPDDTIAYVHCDRPSDEHYATFQAMAEELAAFRTRSGAPYRLIALPWPDTVRDDLGERLPATYANFLVINGAVLVPTYNDPRDSAALDAVAAAFPGRKVIGIDCVPLLLQHGSLHCVTMQLTKGVLP